MHAHGEQHHAGRMAARCKRLAEAACARTRRPKHAQLEGRAWIGKRVYDDRAAAAISVRHAHGEHVEAHVHDPAERADRAKAKLGAQPAQPWLPGNRRLKGPRAGQ